MSLIFPHQPEASLTNLGGKGYALAQLVDAGFNIPPWFGIAPDFYTGDDTGPEAVTGYKFSEAQEARIHEAIAKLGDGPYAVRSSAVDEDGRRASFAGQLNSYLDVPAAAVPERVKAVWASIFAAHVATYRAENAVDCTPSLPGVIIQSMIPAETAGVAFSADAVNGRWAVAVVNAVSGLGEKLVSGAADADNWRVGRDGTILESKAADNNRSPILSDLQAAEVAELARACERCFGCPQDIEWAYASGVLYLLQSRPITTLGRIADPDGRLNLWDNSNIAESYGGVTTPLTYTFAHYIYREVYQQFCRIMHVSESVIADNRSIFNSMLGLIRGRVYYNLMSWYRMLALLPGFRFNRRFMEQMMGVKEGLPESILSGIEREQRGGRLRDGLRLAWAVCGLIRAQWQLPGMIQEFYHHFDATLGTLPAPLHELRLDQLVAHFHKLEEQLLNRWNAPLVNDFFAMIYFGVLRSLTQKWCGDNDGTLQNGLLCGTGNIVSAEPAKRIQELATLASRDPVWTEMLISADLKAIHAAMPAQTAFHTAYQDYLDRFADRCLNELKLESSTLLDDPLPLLRSIGSLARRKQNPPAECPVQNPGNLIQAEAEAKVATALRGRPLRQLIFRHVVKQARRRVRDRENLRFERTRLFGRIRGLFIECGKRLTAVGALEDPRDVFYLEVYEIIGYVEGTGSTTDLRSLIKVRRAEYHRFASEPPPAERFETHGAVHCGNTFQPVAAPSVPAQNDGGLSGIGCCPGQVRGRARVITDPATAHLKPGEILVAEQTDPGWITLFPAAMGVLVERGSLLSHSAIVSREMGIPAIVSISGLLASVRTGDLIEFDGQTGFIQILETAHHD